jgi:hypothetical protein
MEKPTNVVLAIAVLCVYLAIGLMGQSLGPGGIKGLLAHGPYAILLVIFNFLFPAFLTFKISAGKNWARITLSVLFILASIKNYHYLNYAFAHSMITGYVVTAQIILGIIAVFLLLTKSSNIWFIGKSSLSAFEQAKANRLNDA